MAYSPMADFSKYESFPLSRDVLTLLSNLVIRLVCGSSGVWTNSRATETRKILLEIPDLAMKKDRRSILLKRLFVKTYYRRFSPQNHLTLYLALPCFATECLFWQSVDRQCNAWQVLKAEEGLDGETWRKQHFQRAMIR